MIVETYMLMKEPNASFTISVTYSYDDNSDYDYLADYAKMLKGIKKVNQVDGFSGLELLIVKKCKFLVDFPVKKCEF